MAYDKEYVEKAYIEINRGFIESYTDPEIVNEIKEHGISMKQVTDGYHTFDELYYHRMKLFALICHMNKDVAWKSWLHHDGTMFDGSFIVGVQTSEGQYSYHYNAEHFDTFEVRELEKAPTYDGHQPSDIGRLDSLLQPRMPF